MDPKLVRAILTDWRTAPVSDRLRAALRFLEKTTLRPAEIAAEDARELLAVGVSAEGARELLYVCFLFNVLDRLADAFDFDLPTEKGNARIGLLAYRLGYGIAKLPG
jgi:alkylhydroperoxidase family enzyme